MANNYKTGGGNYKNAKITLYTMPANITVNNSETLVNATGLSALLKSGKHYNLIFTVHFVSNTTEDLKINIPALTGAIYEAFALPGTLPIVPLPLLTAFGTPLAIIIPNANQGILVVVAQVLMGTTNQTIQLQFAQNTATVSNTIFYNGSSLEVQQLD